MRISLYALLASLTLAIPAHADIVPSNYTVYPSSPGFAAAPGSAASFRYTVSLGPTNVYFTFGQPIYTGTASSPLSMVEFVGQHVADHITSITLDPSSTIFGIVPLTYIYYGPSYAETFINFDFTNATYVPGNSATFDLGFAAAATPEPSSLLLLATGLLAIGATVRSRLPSASH